MGGSEHSVLIMINVLKKLKGSKIVARKGRIASLTDPRFNNHHLAESKNSGLLVGGERDRFSAKYIAKRR